MFPLFLSAAPSPPRTKTPELHICSRLESNCTGGVRTNGWRGGGREEWGPPLEFLLFCWSCSGVWRHWVSVRCEIRLNLQPGSSQFTPRSLIIIFSFNIKPAPLSLFSPTPRKIPRLSFVSGPAHLEHLRWDCKPPNPYLRLAQQPRRF